MPNYLNTHRNVEWTKATETRKRMNNGAHGISVSRNGAQL